MAPLNLDLLPPEFKNPEICKKFKAWIETGHTGILRIKNKSEQLKNLIKCVTDERKKDPEKVKADFNFFTADHTPLSIKIEEASQKAEERAWEILNLIETKRLTKQYLYEMPPIDGLTLLKVLCYFCVMRDNKEAERRIETQIAQEAKAAFTEKEAALKKTPQKTVLTKPSVHPQSERSTVANRIKLQKNGSKSKKIANNTKTVTKPVKKMDETPNLITGSPKTPVSSVKKSTSKKVKTQKTSSRSSASKGVKTKQA